MKRSVIASTLAGLALAVAPIALPVATAQATSAPAGAASVSTGSKNSWTQSGADAAMSNRNQGETILTSSSVKRLTAKYSLAKVPQYGECGGRDFGGDMPVSDGTSIYWSDGSRMRASNLQTGAATWRAPLLSATYNGNYFVRQIAVSGGLVFVIASDCTRVSEPEGGIIAYRATTGKVVWQTPLYLTPNPLSMTVVGQRLIVSGYDGNESAGTTAYNVADGTTAWSNTQCAQTDYSSAGGPLFIFAVGGVLPEYLCQDPTTGAESSAGLAVTTGRATWTKANGYSYWRGDSSAVATPRAYLTDLTGHIVSMTPAGVRVWRSSTETGKVLAAGPSSVFTDCGTTDSICALDRATGARTWMATVGDNSAGVSVAADVVYPYLLNAATGATLLSQDVSPTGRSGIAAGRLWTENGRVVEVYGLR